MKMTERIGDSNFL